MAEQKIELRKIRDFSLNINDTFLFLRQNIKTLLKAFFAICGVFMLGQAIFSGLYQSHNLGGILQQILKGGVNKQNNDAYNGIFSIEYLMVIIFTLCTFVSMKVVLGAYLKFYVENDGQQPGIEDIWNIFKKYFFKIFIYSIPVFMLIVIGMMFCIAPGIYLAVVMVPFSLIVIIEDANFGYAFNRCFEIIRQNFWTSLAIYLVAFLIYYISSLIIGVVVSIIVGLIAYFTIKNISATVGIVTSFFNVFSYMFYIIYFVSAALQYFTLVENKDGTGILKRIDSIGTGKNNFENTEEQY
jgi:hypothetical protein